MVNEFETASEKTKLQIISSLPIYGWTGISLILIFWPLNWMLSGLRTHWGFFPLWLGFILTMDSLVYLRKGTSLIKRSTSLFIGLFIVSAPVWWLFEILNYVIKNWQYDGREYFTDMEYFLLASLSFSTVIPAVFEAAEFIGSFNWINKFQSRALLSKDERTLSRLFLIGIISLMLLLVFPAYFYYLVWLSVYLVIEPVNIRLKNPSLLDYTAKRDWRPIAALAIGSLMCGFFWEMWNYYSYPKWEYYLPMVNFLHIFEMPVLGYIGYIPFSFELYAVYHLLMGAFKKKSHRDYIQIVKSI